MHRSFCWITEPAGPKSQTRAEIFIDQQLQAKAPQPRCSCSMVRGRPGGLGKRACISA
jgi:hypothetical protein